MSAIHILPKKMYLCLRARAVPPTSLVPEIPSLLQAQLTKVAVCGGSSPRTGACEVLRMGLYIHAGHIALLGLCWGEWCMTHI